MKTNLWFTQKSHCFCLFMSIHVFLFKKQKQDFLKSNFFFICICMVCECLRSRPNLLRTSLNLEWNWKRWTGRIPTSSVPLPSERWEGTRYSSCLMAGEERSITGVSMTPGTSSPWAGVNWPTTVCNLPATAVSTVSDHHQSYSLGFPSVCT